MIIELKGNNKKLLHKAGMYTLLANQQETSERFIFYKRKANKLLEILTNRLEIDRRFNFIAPCKDWNSVKIFIYCV